MIHPTAQIHNNAKVSSDVSIGPYSNIGSGVEIKSGVKIESHVRIDGKVSIEESVKIFSHAKIGNENSEVVIGRGSHIREFVQIAVDKRGSVEIGDEVFLMAYVQIHADVKIGDNSVLTNAVCLREDVECEERVIIGGLSSVDRGVKIGTGVMIGGASHLKSSIPPFCLVEGSPAKVRGLNAIGIRRRFQNGDDISMIKNAYKSTYRDGVDKSSAKEIIKSDLNSNSVRFAQFIVDNL